MANTRTLTSANAILYLAVENLYPTPQRIQGFAADNITDIEGIANVEAMQGVDGRLSFGWVPNPLPQTITLQADSESLDFFENWAAAQRQTRNIYVATGSLVLIATGRKYAMTRGALTNYKPIPALGRTLAPRGMTITWEDVQPAPM